MSEIKLDMRLKQALRISPQLLQSTQILQMNAQNLREYVDKALEENPVLDKAPEYEAPGHHPGKILTVRRPGLGIPL